MTPIETLLKDYPKSIVKRKNCAENYKDMTIVLLLIRHSSAEVQIQNFFNKKVVESLYKNGDTIYVEESKNLRNNQLQASKVFDPQKYRLKGWEEAEISEAARKLKEKLNEILALVNKLSNNLLLNAEEWENLNSFAAENGIQVPSFEEMQNIITLKTFTNKCLRAICDIREHFIRETFPERQDRLIKKLSKHGSKEIVLSTAIPSKIIVCVGESHVRKNNNPQFGKEAIKLRKAISKASYLILNAHFEKETINRTLLSLSTPIPENMILQFLARFKAIINNGNNQYLAFGRITNFVGNFLSCYLPFSSDGGILSKVRFM